MNRFKTEYSPNHRQYSTKNNDMIDALIDKLDLTNYVENRDLPNAYFDDDELNQNLNSYSFSSKNMNVNFCVEECSKRNYNYQ